MDKEKNDLFFINKIIADLSFVMEYTDGLSRDDIEKNPLLVDSIMFRIIQISENSDRLTQEVRDTHPNVPWRSIKGMRNLIVHDYGVVDLSIVYDTVINSIPEYLNSLSKTIEEINP